MQIAKDDNDSGNIARLVELGAHGKADFGWLCRVPHLLNTVGGKYRLRKYLKSLEEVNATCEAEDRRFEREVVRKVAERDLWISCRHIMNGENLDNRTMIVFYSDLAICCCSKCAHDLADKGLLNFVTASPACLKTALKRYEQILYEVSVDFSTYLDGYFIYESLPDEHSCEEIHTGVLH